MERKEITSEYPGGWSMSVTIGGDYSCSPDFSVGCGKVRNRLVEEWGGAVV